MKNLLYIWIVLAGTGIFTGCDHFLDDAPRGNAIAQTAEDYDRMFNASQIMNMMLNEAYYTSVKISSSFFQ